ncbi:MAG: SDR family NAD(P)-dependent oxidoreductase [Polyangiales bacterium]
MPGFVERYGPWAVVAGASEGIGASFSRKLAARGLNLILVARRAAPLETLAAELRDQHGIEVRVQPLDLGSADAVSSLGTAIEGLDVGLLIYNAAYSPIGRFIDVEVEEHLKAVAVNVQGPLRFSHYFGRRLAERGKGGIILMSSMSGYQGTAMVANYAATKAYDTILAEGLWYELRGRGVDVLACIAGATLTPSYESVTDDIPTRGPARPMDPDDVTEQALHDLGRRPSRISGLGNRLAYAFLHKILGRRATIGIFSKETVRLYG